MTPAGVWPPWRSRSSWPLKVSLTDSMTWRSGLRNRAPGRSSSPLRAGQQLGQARVVCEDVDQGLPLVGFGAGEGVADGQAVQGAQQVQPQPPEPAGMGGAVAVLGPSGQIRPVRGLAGAAALDRGGVHYPDVVVPQAGVGGERPDEPGHGRGELAQPLVVAGLAGQAGEQVPQASAGVAQPPRLRGEPQQSLQYRQGEQFGV